MVIQGQSGKTFICLVKSLMLLNCTGLLLSNFILKSYTHSKCVSMGEDTSKQNSIMLDEICCSEIKMKEQHCITINSSFDHLS